jgi:hypothetical protein
MCSEEFFRYTDARIRRAGEGDGDHDVSSPTQHAEEANKEAAKSAALR